MPRDITTGLSNLLDDVAVTPLLLVELGFNTPIRYSSRETVTLMTETFLAADIQFRFGSSPSITVFNESGTFGNTVLTQGTGGRTVKIWETYHNGTSWETPELIFQGVMGAARIGENVNIKLKMHRPTVTPRFRAVPPTFNHLPVSGTKIVTPTQVITLETQ